MQWREKVSNFNKSDFFGDFIASFESMDIVYVLKSRNDPCQGFKVPSIEIVGYGPFSNMTRNNMYVLNSYLIKKKPKYTLIKCTRFERCTAPFKSL